MSSAKRTVTHSSPNRNSTTADQYDHAIVLVDSTRPATPPSEAEPADDLENSSRRSASPPKVSTEEDIPTRVWSKNNLSKEIARRKYARFQESRYSQDDEDSDSAVSRGRRKAFAKDIHDRKGRVLERLHLRPRQQGKASAAESVIDILYENQRGLFMFGYPLYSSRSLLNFDPGAWTDARFHDSVVDIRNAQVPDPTWAWSWKRWYVDMSGDVDEQGWEYSLMFGKKFSWHGTHPWFHSAVRRRRWLRKRARIQQPHHTADPHDLAPDYFTIHARTRERSRGSSIASRTIDRSSRYSEMQRPAEEEEDIDNIATLLRIMKNTSVDRKKIEAVKNFISHGGTDLQLLPDMLPDIWNLLLYQNSRRELLDILEDAEQQLADSQEGQGESIGTKSIDLRAALEAAHNDLSQIEFYSDAKAMGKELAGDEGKQKSPISNKQSDSSASDENTTTELAIRGIPERAGLDVEPGIAIPPSQDTQKPA